MTIKQKIINTCICPLTKISRHRIIRKYQHSSDSEIQQLFQYLQNHPIDIWNGSQECDEEKLLADIVMERDSATDLFYTLWNGRRLYFPRGSEPDVNKQYVLSILKEQLPTSPHCYCQSDVYVEKGDVIVDAGAAEGFWALDQADKAGHIFLIECSEAWIEALKATFAPYREKTTIIPKFLGGGCPVLRLLL